MKRFLTFKYAILQGTYWMGACFFYSFAQTFLEAKGLGKAEVGLVLAISNIAAFLLQPIVASLLDKNRKVTFKNTISALIATALLCALAILVAKPSMLISILFIVLTTLTLVVQPLVNSIGFAFIDRGEKLNYSAARGIGSACYALMALVYGRLALINVDYLLYGFALMSALLLVTNLWLAPKKEIATDTDKIGGNIQLLKKHPSFFVMLIGLVLLFMQHNAINAYLLSIVKNVGGNESNVGVAVFIAAIFEVPVMLLYTRLQSKIRCESLIKFAALFFTVKSALLVLPLGLAGVYISQALQLAGYAIMIPATGYYANNLVDVTDKVKGQALLTTAIVIAGVFGYQLGGILMEWSVQGTLLVGTGVSLIGSVIMLLSTKKILPKEVET